MGGDCLEFFQKNFHSPKDHRAKFSLVQIKNPYDSSHKVLFLIQGLHVDKKNKIIINICGIVFTAILQALEQ